VSTTRVGKRRGPGGGRCNKRSSIKPLPMPDENPSCGPPQLMHREFAGFVADPLESPVRVRDLAIEGHGPLGE